MTTKLTPAEVLQNAFDDWEDLLPCKPDWEYFAGLCIDAAVARGEVVRVTPSEVPANASERIERDWPAWKKQMREQARNAEQYVRENDEDERAHCRAALAPLWRLEGEHWGISGVDEHVELLLRERAQARAEGRAAEEKWTDAWDVKMHETQQQLSVLTQRFDTVKAELTALRAAHERLREAADAVCGEEEMRAAFLADYADEQADLELDLVLTFLRRHDRDRELGIEPPTLAGIIQALERVEHRR